MKQWKANMWLFDLLQDDKWHILVKEHLQIL